MSLTRADLESGHLQKLLQAPELGLRILNEVELQDSIREILKQQTPRSDVWIFAYGSLIWNPIVRYTEHRIGTVDGWHRQFCLWTPLGRGTPENPGLILGLEAGDCCQGIAYRIAAADVPSEMLLLWKREMVVGSYVPRWVKVIDGEEEIEAIAFTINHKHSMYAGNLPNEVIINHLATAVGPLGSCADYFTRTVEALKSFGIEDEALFHLHDHLCVQRQLLAKTFSSVQ